MTATRSCANLLLRMTNTSGIISQRGWNFWSPVNVDCQWNISSNAMLQLVFVRFKTQTSTDFVRVYDGGSSSSPLIGRFSGSSLPAPITSSSGNLYVRFTSNSSRRYGEFEAHYRGMHRASEKYNQKKHIASTFSLVRSFLL